MPIKAMAIVKAKANTLLVAWEMSPLPSVHAAGQPSRTGVPDACPTSFT